MTGNVKLDLLTFIKTKRKCFSSYTDVFKITTKHRGAYLLKFHIFSFTFKAWKRQIQKWEFTEYLLTLRHPRCRWDHQNRFGEVLHHLFTSGSSAVNGCRQNESPNSNHSNPHHSSPSVNNCLCEAKSCNKSIKAFFSFKLSFLAKIWVSIIHNNSSFSEKVHPLLFSHIKIHRHICLELFLLVIVAWSVHISLLIQTRQLPESNILDRGLVF